MTGIAVEDIGRSALGIFKRGEELVGKTITIATINRKSHPLYGKTVHTTVKFKAHDENNEAHEGDTVEIAETRRMSKDKRWRLVRVVEKKK
jgi:small subunit ribosomal protein S17